VGGRNIQRDKVVTEIGVGTTVFMAILAGGFYFGTLQMKQDFGERVASQETLAKSLEKKTDFLIEKYILPGSKAQAEKILQGRNIQVAYVTPKSNVTLASAPESRGSGNGLFALYQIEGFISGKLIVRIQLEEYKAGKFFRFLYDRRVQIKPPSKIGQRDLYDFAFFDENDPKKEPAHPPIRIELVVLERVGDDGLIVASALGPTPESQAG
jgi:hypothetical protein